MSRQPHPEIPLWQRSRTQRGHHVVLSRRDSKRLVREVAALTAAQQSPAQPGAAAAARGTFQHPAWRFRYQLVPVWWLAGAAIAGPGLHATGRDRAGVAAGLASAALIWLVTRHKKGTGRKLCTAMAALTALWVPVLAETGMAKPWPAIALICWAGLMIPWCHHYRWRKEDVKPVRHANDQEIWAKLAAKNRWSGYLQGLSSLPDGGRQWGIVLDGSETHIGQVLSEPRKIAAAWGKAVTEAYAEPSPDGIESRGRLTILRRSTLDKPRQWDGTGIDLDTGMAVVGRFPDGQPVRERYFIPRNGVRHTLAAGADGSGKTGILELGLCLSATSGVIAPVILDPQEGQALPAWRDHVPYASGAGECFVYLAGLHAAMLDRSRYLASMPWTAPDGSARTGMAFFDAVLTGLPIVEITVDESPALLAHPVHGAAAAYLLGEIGKLGRKAGFRIRLAVQHPSLSELGNHPPLRSMLVGGNVFCGRTGDAQTQGMIGVKGDPRQIPKYFADGSPTVGLGYADGPDNRPGTPARWDWVPDPHAVARRARIRGLDERCAEAMRTAMKAAVTQLAAVVSPGLAAVPDEDEPPSEGRSCADAILAVLDRQMTKGEIMTRAAQLVTGEWGRRKPFTARAFSDAFTRLADEKRIVKHAHNTYAPVRPSLTVVGGSGGDGMSAS